MTGFNIEAVQRRYSPLSDLRLVKLGLRCIKHFEIQACSIFSLAFVGQLRQTGRDARGLRRRKKIKKFAMRRFAKRCPPITCEKIGNNRNWPKKSFIT